MEELKKEHINELLKVTGELYELNKRTKDLESRVSELKAILATVDFLEKQAKQTDNDSRKD